MKWLTYIHPQCNEQRAGFLFRHHIIDLDYILHQDFQVQSEYPLTQQAHHRDMPPSSLLQYIRHRSSYEALVNERIERLDKLSSAEWHDFVQKHSGWLFPFEPSKLGAALCPQSFRDFYAFEEHVQTARGRRGLSMVEQWYHFPVFYFSNHQSMIGPDETVHFPSASQKWDYELEVGIVIGKEGCNISREEAFDYVFGLTIINDWSARDIQAEEVKVGLGPAKGKDFATSVGPFILTPTEWKDRKEGEHIRLKMEAYVNGEKKSAGNLASLYWSIPQLIERASKDCTLYPGDLLGTGTVGTGCILEHEDQQWLKPGDEVSLKVERLGVLTNQVGSTSNSNSKPSVIRS